MTKPPAGTMVVVAATFLSLAACSASGDDTGPTPTLTSETTAGAASKPSNGSTKSITTSQSQEERPTTSDEVDNRPAEEFTVGGVIFDLDEGWTEVTGAAEGLGRIYQYGEMESDPPAVSDDFKQIRIWMQDLMTRSEIVDVWGLSRDFEIEELAGDNGVVFHCSFVTRQANEPLYTDIVFVPNGTGEMTKVAIGAPHSTAPEEIADRILAKVANG